jgi:uncharacterized protein (DUF2252 family)
MGTDTTLSPDTNSAVVLETLSSPPTPSGDPNEPGAVAQLRLEERAAHGRALREKVPRKSHASWAETPDRADPIALLEAQARTRVPELVPMRYGRMQVSPFAFLRGSAIVMAHDLARTPTTGLQTQLCGDAHLCNFGVYASPERTLVFDINDFDETLPGPWEWDLKRLAASCYVAGRGNGCSEADCRQTVRITASAYRRHMAEFATMGNLAVWYAHITADELMALIVNKRTQKRAQQLLAKTRQRDSLQAFSKLTEVVDGCCVIANDPPLVVRVPEEKQQADVHWVFNAYAQTLRADYRHLLARYALFDMAFKVVGVGSVGTRCYMLLLLGDGTDDPLLLQAKEAQASVLEASLPKSAFENQGERVVAGQRLMQAASDIFLGWVRGPAGRDFYVRQLRDMKGSAEVATLSPAELALWASSCGWALARAHARSGDRVQIAAYLGASAAFDDAIVAFAEAYADQTERDYRTFLAAIKSGRITATTIG